MKLKENEKRDKYLDLVRDLKKTFEHEGDVDTNCIWSTWNNPQSTVKGIGRYLDDGIIIEKSPGVLRRLAVTQISVRKH